MDTCSHCHYFKPTIIVMGKRLITIDEKEELIAYCICTDCNDYLHSANNQYNNAKRDEMEKLKTDFWEKVDTYLTLQHFVK